MFDLGQPELVMEWTCNKWTRGHAKNKHEHTANAVDKTKQGERGYLMYEWLAECVIRTTALCRKSLGENVAVEPEATSSELR